MASGFPDWTYAVALIGQDPDGNLVLIQVDGSGQLTVPFKGINPDSDLVTVAVDADGQLYSIMKGTDGNIMAVDSDGYMTAILKGDYLGALRTIGLDDDGRISGYLVDDEDQWGEILKVGNAEQAARLGSPVSFDRRGQVQHLYTFADGHSAFSSHLAGTGAAVALSPVGNMVGGYSVLLTAGSDGLRYAYILSKVGIPPDLSVGLSMRFATDNPPESVTLSVQIYNGTERIYFQVLYTFATGVTQIYRYNNTTTTVGTVVTSNSLTTFNYIKVVGDGTSKLYKHVIVNGTEIDCSAYTGHYSASATAPRVDMLVWVTGNAADNDRLYLDNLILTTREP